MKLAERPVVQPARWRVVWAGLTGRRDAAYVVEALFPVWCHRCRRTIQPGEHFSRVAMPGYVYCRAPVCGACRPVEQIADRDELPRTDHSPLPA